MTDFRRRAALAVLLTAEAMNMLDGTIVHVAAPVIHARLGGRAADVPWFTAAYTLPFALLLITGGRLGDIAGRARVFRIGVAGFTLASAACAMAGSPGALIAARAVQGACAALVIPQTIGLIRARFEGPALARAMGAIGPVMGLSAVCGPVLGGLLTEALSWRGAFLVNVPLGVAVLAASGVLREDRAARRPRPDLPGTALVTVGTGLVVFPLVQTGGGSWQWGGAVVGAAVLAALVPYVRWSARRGRSPLVEPSLFANRGFPAALVASVLFFAVMTGLSLVIAMSLQSGRAGADARTAGLAMLPWSAGMAVASWAAGTWLVPRIGARLMFVGLAVLGAGILGMVAVEATSPGSRWMLEPALGIAGCGLGLFTVPFFTTALHRVRPHETGSAAGLLNAVQQVGGTLGVALLGGTFLAAAPAHGPAAATERAAGAALALLPATAFAASFMTRKTRAPRPSAARTAAAQAHD
ncbi:MFS transporter [Actinomadura gamaensis]|uniref:MFS transporter n=1 Tax=Actinomadura gamaensis TaxID=1763541 RepID=A0ABV9UB21_9ACTN